MPFCVQKQYCIYSEPGYFRRLASSLKFSGLLPLNSRMLISAGHFNLRDELVATVVEFHSSPPLLAHTRVKSLTISSLPSVCSMS